MVYKAVTQIGRDELTLWFVFGSADTDGRDVFSVHNRLAEGISQSTNQSCQI